MTLPSSSGNAEAGASSAHDDNSERSALTQGVRQVVSDSDLAATITSVAQRHRVSPDAIITIVPPPKATTRGPSTQGLKQARRRRARKAALTGERELEAYRRSYNELRDTDKNTLTSAELESVKLEEVASKLRIEALVRVEIKAILECLQHQGDKGDAEAAADDLIKSRGLVTTFAELYQRAIGRELSWKAQAAPVEDPNPDTSVPTGSKYASLSAGDRFTTTQSDEAKRKTLEQANSKILPALSDAPNSVEAARFATAAETELELLAKNHKTLKANQLVPAQRKTRLLLQDWARRIVECLYYPHSSSDAAVASSALIRTNGLLAAFNLLFTTAMNRPLSLGALAAPLDLGFQAEPWSVHGQLEDLARRYATSIDTIEAHARQVAPVDDDGAYHYLIATKNETAQKFLTKAIAMTTEMSQGNAANKAAAMLAADKTAKGPYFDHGTSVLQSYFKRFGITIPGL